MRSKILLALLPLLSLVGCLLIREPADSSLKFNPDGATGIIVGSITHGQKKGSPDFAQIQFTKTDRKADGLVKSGAVLGFGSEGKDFPDDPTIRGTIFAFELPAGDYHFDVWYIQDSNIMISPSVRLQPLAFTVQPGSVTYVGNFFAEPVVVNNVLGTQTAVGGSAKWIDNFKRDLPLIAKKYPGIPLELITDKTMDDHAWVGVPMKRTVTIYH